MSPLLKPHQWLSSSIQSKILSYIVYKVLLTSPLTLSHCLLSLVSTQDTLSSFSIQGLFSFCVTYRTLFLKLQSIFCFFFLLYFTLQYCIDFAIHWHESTMGIHAFRRDFKAAHVCPVVSNSLEPHGLEPHGSRQALLFTEFSKFSKQEYWNGLLFPTLV